MSYNLRPRPAGLAASATLAASAGSVSGKKRKSPEPEPESESVAAAGSAGPSAGPAAAGSAAGPVSTDPVETLESQPRVKRQRQRADRPPTYTFVLRGSTDICRIAAVRSTSYPHFITKASGTRGCELHVAEPAASTQPQLDPATLDPSHYVQVVMCEFGALHLLDRTRTLYIGSCRAEAGVPITLPSHLVLLEIARCPTSLLIQLLSAAESCAYLESLKFGLDSADLATSDVAEINARLARIFSLRRLTIRADLYFPMGIPTIRVPVWVEHLDVEGSVIVDYSGTELKRLSWAHNCANDMPKMNLPDVSALQELRLNCFCGLTRFQHAGNLRHLWLPENIGSIGNGVILFPKLDTVDLFLVQEGKSNLLRSLAMSIKPIHIRGFNFTHPSLHDVAEALGVSPETANEVALTTPDDELDGRNVSVMSWSSAVKMVRMGSIGSLRDRCIKTAAALNVAADPRLPRHLGDEIAAIRTAAAQSIGCTIPPPIPSDA